MSDHEEEHTIAEDLVVTKYKMAGEIVNRKCVEGAASYVVIRKFKFRASMFDAAHGKSRCPYNKLVVFGVRFLQCFIYHPESPSRGDECLVISPLVWEIFR